MNRIVGLIVAIVAWQAPAAFAQGSYDDAVRQAGEQALAAQLQSKLSDAVGSHQYYEHLRDTYGGYAASVLQQRMQNTEILLGDMKSRKSDPDSATIRVPRGLTQVQMVQKIVEAQIAAWWNADPGITNFAPSFLQSMGLNFMQAREALNAIYGRGRLFSRFADGANVGPDATRAELEAFTKEAESRGAVVVRSSTPFAPGVQASTFIDENGKVTVLLPPEGQPVKKIALVDEKKHVDQLADAIRDQGLEAVRKIFEQAGAGDPAANRQLVDWEIEAKKAALDSLGADDPARPIVQRSLDDLEARRAGGVLTDMMDGVSSAIAHSLAPSDAVRTRGIANSLLDVRVKGAVEKAKGDDADER